MGANLVGDGCTFRVWAPRATEVFICGDFAGWGPTEVGRLVQLSGGHWAGFVPGVADGTEYKFWIRGQGSAGLKRDPFARELSTAPAFPHSNCVVRDPAAYPWHDAGFRPPAFSDLVVYQLHVGAFARRGPGKGGRFLDVLERIPYLADLGVNAVELLPIVEFPQDTSLGYNGVDFYSPEMNYAVPPGELPGYVTKVNELLTARGRGLVDERILSTQVGQLKALIDVCHAYGLAILFDVVCNHAGSGDFGGSQTTAESLYFFVLRLPDRPSCRRAVAGGVQQRRVRQLGEPAGGRKRRRGVGRRVADARLAGVCRVGHPGQRVAGLHPRLTGAAGRP